MRCLHHLLLLFAITVCNVGLAQTPQPEKAVSPDLLAEALHAYRTGNFDDAISKYNALIAVDPKSAEAYAGLVRVFIKQDNVEKAAEAASHAIEADPKSNIAQTAQAELLFRQGKIAEAEPIYVKVINSGELNARAYWGLSRIRTAISMHKRAKDLLDRAHSFDPDDPDIQRSWMSTLKRSERVKFLEHYLASPTNDDSQHRESLDKYLTILKDRDQHPERRCRLVNKAESTTVPLVRMMTDPTRLYGYGLAVRINDQHARLLLDTGAGGLLVRKAIAEKAGIRPIVETKIRGIGDKEGTDAFAGYADSIRIGDLEFRNCVIEVTQKNLNAGDDGLIGADVFSDYLIGIDFTAEKLKLTPLPPRPNQPPKSVALSSEGADQDDEDIAEDCNAKTDTSCGPQDRYISPEMKDYTRIYRFGHNLLIPTRVGDIPAKLFLIDTGAFTNAISPSAAREVTKLHTEPGIKIRGLSGSVNKVMTADKAVLQFGRFSQENQELISWDFSKINKALGTEVSGFLGFATLRMFELKIDYRDGLVDFVFNNARVYGK